MNIQLQVLIVDDDNEANKTNNRLIKESGICSKVKVALNGGHALLYLHQMDLKLCESKLLILLDIDMPIMNGLEFINNLNRFSYPFKDDLIIVMMTTPRTNKFDIDKAKSLGVKHFIQKPLTGEELKKLLKSDSLFQQVA